MTILLSTWLVNNHSVELRYSVCQQPLKEGLSTVKDCTKSLYCLSLKNWWSDEENESKHWSVHSYVCQLWSEQLSKLAFNDWASYKQSWLCVNRGEPFLSFTWVPHKASAIVWEIEPHTIRKKPSSESRPNCTKDEEGNRVSWDNHDCHLTDAERDCESKVTAAIQFQERRQDLTEPEEHSYEPAV